MAYRGNIVAVLFHAIELWQIFFLRIDSCLIMCLTTDVSGKQSLKDRYTIIVQCKYGYKSENGRLTHQPSSVYSTCLTPMQNSKMSAVACLSIFR
jgi:hypothetical protein